MDKHKNDAQKKKQLNTIREIREKHIDGATAKELIEAHPEIHPRGIYRILANEVFHDSLYAKLRPQKHTAAFHLPSILTKRLCEQKSFFTISKELNEESSKQLTPEMISKTLSQSIDKYLSQSRRK